MKITKKFLAGVGLLLLSILLFSIMFPVAAVATIFKGWHRNNAGEFAWHIGTYLRNVAFSLDQTGNVMFADLWNYTLRKKGGYAFGNPDETISSALGRNKLAGTLSVAGRFLARFLNRIDKDHVENAIGH